MKRKLYLLILSTCILVTGCMIGREKEEDLNYSETIDVGLVDQEILNTSEKIADSVVELYGIDNSTAIVFNEDVLVGVILGASQDMTEDMRESIRDTIKDNNPSIKNVYISLDEKIFREIDNIIIDLLNGESYESYLDKISQIFGKINKDK